MDSVAEVRAFNRFYTEEVGLLDYRDTALRYSLAEARVIYELGAGPADTTELRTRLGLDAGYLSRILRSFTERGLVDKQPASDARRNMISLTSQGKVVQRLLDDAASKHIAGHLKDLTDGERARLVGAMRTVRELLSGFVDPTVLLRAPYPGELGWVIARNGALYAAEHGWDTRYEALVARIIAEFAARVDTRGEAAWIAELDGRPAGAVFCMRDDEHTARLRCLHVEPGARGMGIGGRLVGECVNFARRGGYRRMVLWTVSLLAEARRGYERAGFQLDAEEPHPGFGYPVTGQTWSLEL